VNVSPSAGVKPFASVTLSALASVAVPLTANTVVLRARGGSAELDVQRTRRDPACRRR